MNLGHKRLMRERIIQEIRPSDIVNLTFVLFLLLLSIFFANRVLRWYLLVPLYACMLCAALCLIWLCHEGRKTSPVIAFLRLWYPVIFVLVIFFSLSGIVHHILPYDVDSELIKIDQAIFGAHPTVFLSRFLNPYLVDVLELCYATFYFLPLILGLALYCKGKNREFETYAFVACLGFYLSYLGNLLFPASGPSHTLTALHSIPLEGKWVGGSIRTLLFALEPYWWDCFPSGHVSVTLITLIICFRFERQLFWWMLPVGSGLIVSTVLLRYHYVIDVIAGTVLAIIIVGIVAISQRLWNRYKQLKAENVSVLAYLLDRDIS